jgi:amino acid adenylation domain-containing protein
MPDDTLEWPFVPIETEGLLLMAAERRQLVVECNNPDTQSSAHALLHDFFEAHAARTPDAVALVSDGRVLSYGELDRRANQLGHALRKRGVGPDCLVSLCVNRTPSMIVALLGILKAGGAYVPLDPEYPADRLAFMLEDCGARTLITEETLQRSFPRPSAVSEIIYLDRDTEALAAESHAKPLSEVLPDNLACAVYTSGSTGQPKAALLTHRGLFNLAVSEIRLYGIGPQSRVLQLTSLSFDTSISEIAMALGSGAALYVEARRMILPGGDLERYLEREKITVLSLTPSALTMLDPTAVRSVEQLIVGGEPCPAGLVARWANRCRFFNAYGPTETSVTTTCVEYRHGALPPLIGRPLPNVRVYLLDQLLEPVAIGVTGELYIGGVGVARGYLGRPKLSAECFLPDPFSDRPGALMYRTGDFGRWRPDGQVDFIGRIDDQVKIRGFRIELTEIEANLAEHPSVRQAAVHLCTVKTDDVRIVACCVPANAGGLTSIGLRKHLRARLPEYMIPQHFLIVNEIPMTPNSKVDRRRLPKPVITESRIRQHEAPLNQVEETIAGIWTELIHPARPIGRADNFFEMGGHSLLGLQALRQLEDQLGVRLELHVLYQESLAEIATRCSAERIDG